MKRKLIQYISLLGLGSLVILSGCGKKETTAELIKNNLDSFKQYEITEEDTVEERSFSAIAVEDYSNLDKLVSKSELVVRGEVTEERYCIPYYPTPYTFYSVQVNEVLKGEELAKPGEIIAVGEMQGMMTAKDYKEVMIENGLRSSMDESFDAPDEELEQIYYNYSDGSPTVHAGDELIFALYKTDNYVTNDGGYFWHVRGSRSSDGKFYKIGEDEYMRVYSSGEESNLTREIAKIEPKPMDEVFSLEELENLF